MSRSNHFIANARTVNVLTADAKTTNTMVANSTTANTYTFDYPTWGASSYATLDPLNSDISYGLILSNGYLTAYNPETFTLSVQATIPLSSGKWYWEMERVGSATFGFSAGVWREFIEGDFMGNEPDHKAIQSDNGQKRSNSISEAYFGVTVGVGDVVGTKLNMDAGTIGFTLNGVDTYGDAYTSLSGVYIPAVSVQQSNTVTFNFGATPFAYTVPAGYNPGVYCDDIYA